MRFTPAPLDGAWLIEEERRVDSRGWFTRAFCADEFARMGLETSFPQVNRSLSLVAGTLRGMHYQREPHSEVKVVCCLRGAIYDVIVDVRPGSPSYLRWHAVRLSAQQGRWLYVPRGFAHGFLTLEDNTEVLYLVSTPYAPHAEAGFRYDDPAVGISWPGPPKVVSVKDLAWPPLLPATDP